MTRTFGTAYAICTLLFILTLSAVFLVRLNDGRNESISASEAHFADLRRSLSHSTPDSVEIQRALSVATTADTALRAVAVYTFESGLQYLWARNRAYLADNLGDLPVALTPEFTYNRLSEISLNDRIRRGDGQTVAIETVYRVIPGEIWFRLIRDSLLAILVFTLLTVLVVTAVLLAFRDPVPARTGPNRPTKPRPVSGPPVNRVAPSATPTSVPAEGTAHAAAGMFNPDSGVSYEAHLSRRLTLELERAAANDQDLGFALVRFPGLSRGTERYQSCARAMVERFLFEDLIFEQGSDGFAVLLPNVDLNQVIKQFELFVAEMRVAPLPGRLFIGITARSGRLVESDRLIREAQHALVKAQSDNRYIIAFRADPQRYRDMVTEQGD